MLGIAIKSINILHLKKLVKRVDIKRNKWEEVFRVKRKIIIVSGFCILLFAGTLCVHASNLTMNLFVNEKGEKFYQSYPEASEEEIMKTVESQGITAFENNDTPDNPQIGDIFKSKDGYEKVIAVSEDGAFISEVVTTK